MYAKLSKKGQVTIPKAIREKLSINDGGGVLFLVEKNGVKIKGVRVSSAGKLSGSLKKYSRRYVPLEKVRKQIQPDIATDISKEGT